MENEIDRKYIYENTAKQIEREDGLVSTRMTWMLTIHGFLFTALAIIGGKESDPTVVKLLKDVLPATGFILSIMGLVGILGANLAVYDLKSKWRKIEEEMNVKPPRPFGGTLAFWLGLSPSILIPTILSIIWGYVFFKL